MMRRRMSEGNAWPSPAGASRRRFRLREVVAMRGADSGATRNQTPEVVQVLRVSAGTVVRDRTARNARRRSAGIAGDQHGELQRYARLRRRHGARAGAGAAADYQPRRHHQGTRQERTWILAIVSEQCPGFAPKGYPMWTQSSLRSVRRLAREAPTVGGAAGNPRRITPPRSLSV